MPIIEPLVKRAIRRVERALNPLPDWASTIRDESNWWKLSQPQWAELLKKDSALWKASKERAKKGPKILMATGVGGFPTVTIVDSLLAVALTLRGAEVHILLCDKFLPACSMTARGFFPITEEFVKHGPSTSLCKVCFAPGHRMFRSLGLPMHRFSDFVSDKERQNSCQLSGSVPIHEIPGYCLDGVPTGEHAYSGALRYFARGDLEGEPQGEPILRRYLDASILTVYGLRRLLRTWSFEASCFIHGIYVPHGVIPEVCRQEKVRSVSWSHTYRKHTFIFSHEDTYHHTMLVEPASNWENMKWTPECEIEIVDYLKSRWYGTRDWISYADNVRGKELDVEAELGVDLSKPCIGMLTNVIWDAQVNYRNNAFPNMLEWVLQTIRYFVERPDLQLILRAHPAELRHGIKSRQFIVDEIRREFPDLPKNIVLIGPENPISTYAVMMKCDSVLIWATNAGIELAGMGIPIIVAGEAWVKNKGVTLDANSAPEYFDLLKRLPIGRRMDEATTLKARKYAYHYFFRRMIPLGFLQPSKHSIFYDLKISGLDDLMPGRSVGLDVICKGILSGEEFNYPAELVREDFDER